MSVVAFTVHGVAAPQGSKTPWGTEANPNTRPWRASVTASAAEVMNGHEPFTGPLALTVTFYFPRPKSHYGSGKNANVLKPNAPVWHTAKPDTDKLLRAIGDALTGLMVRDDSHFSHVSAVKAYGTPRAEIQVTELDQAALSAQTSRTIEAA